MSRGKGFDRLWGWFGLSRASFITIPRILMHEMPDEWQEKMAELLEQYDEAFPNQPDVIPYVVFKNGNGRFTQGPKWMLEYRHPDPYTHEIKKMRAPYVG